MMKKKTNYLYIHTFSLEDEKKSNSEKDHQLNKLITFMERKEMKEKT